jgi:plasmid stabilization system protein ParE
MRVVLTSATETDLAAVLDWYDAEAPGVGRRFLDEFETLLQRLAANPKQFPGSVATCVAPSFAVFPTAYTFASARRSSRSSPAFMRAAIRSPGKAGSNG